MSIFNNKHQDKLYFQKKASAQKEKAVIHKDQFPRLFLSDCLLEFVFHYKSLFEAHKKHGLFTKMISGEAVTTET